MGSLSVGASVGRRGGAGGFPVCRADATLQHVGAGGRAGASGTCSLCHRGGRSGGRGIGTAFGVLALPGVFHLRHDGNIVACRFAST